MLSPQAASTSWNRLNWLACLVAIGWSCTLPIAIFADDPDKGTSREVALARVTADIKYLASDELGGRLPGTPEMDQCVKYIVDEFKRVGIKPGMPDGTYLQTLDVSENLGSSRTLLKDDCSLVLVAPGNEEIKLTLDEQFKPQICRENFDLNTGLVFVGYGIRSEEHNFDEYRGVDVKGKVVVMVRVEPQQTKADSVFNGTENSIHAMMQTKVAAARRAGAAAILMVNDGQTAPTAEKDELAAYEMFGRVTNQIPFAHIKRSTLDALLQKSPLVHPNGDKLDSVAQVEKVIDDTLSPLSQEMDCQVKFAAKYDQKQVLTSNIIGVIEGEGPHADETIVIGGHYDHLGKGAFGSRAPGRNEVHNGADDNATGTAGVMELARRFAKSDKKPARRLVFICFTAEEMGLIGAQHYVQNPVFPLEKTVAMINYDMIGWLRDNKLTCYSWFTGDSFGSSLDRVNEKHKLELVKPEQGFAGSDHLPFMQRGIPVMFLHTGITDTYHTPEDDFSTINCDGALKVIEFTEDLLWDLASLPERPKFSNVPGGGAPRIRLGALITELDGKVSIDSVTDDSLAAKIGLKPADVITELAGEAINSRRQINRLLAANANKTIKIKVEREGKPVEIEFKVESIGSDN